MADVITKEKAFKSGFAAAQAGQPESSNPYKEFPNTSAAWVEGYKEGKKSTGR